MSEELNEQPDLLRISFVDPKLRHDKEARERIRQALIKLITSKLEEMPDHEVQEVAQFVEVVENDHGCSTPAEEFLTGLVGDYTRGRLTPEVAESRLETFKDNFDDAIRDAKLLMRQYPDLFKSEGSESHA